MDKHSQPDDFTLGPTLEFMQSFWRLNHALERLSRRMESTCGVTAQQRTIIRCVGRYPGIPAGQLARQLHLDAGTVSATLGRLERKGLLERRRAHRDRRRVTLGLTAAGRAIDQEVGTLERSIQRLRDSTSAEELACTRRVLEALANQLELDWRGRDEAAVASVR